MNGLSQETYTYNYGEETTQQTIGRDNIESVSFDENKNHNVRFQNYQKEYEKYRKMMILDYESEISTIILHDDYIDGEISNSETFMENAVKKGHTDYVMEALMQLYSNNLLNTHVLEGILVMISSVSYETVWPKGQIMAIGLLSNRELAVRDKAIQCFERWNSRKGLEILRAQRCSPAWLQKYANKVVMYIERNGFD